MHKIICTIAIILVGCTPAPDVPSYLPTIAVAAAVEGSYVPTPEPSDECENCDGRGWLGDGQPRADCLDCNTEWDDKFGAAAPDIQKLIELIEALTLRIEKLEQQRRPPAPAPAAPPPQAAGAKPIAPAAIQWVSLDAARESPKPVLAYVTRAWCGPCQRMQQTLFRDPRVIQATQDWACVKLDQPSQLQSRYGISSYPAFITFTEPGRPGKVVTGVQSVGSFLSLLGSTQ